MKTSEEYNEEIIKLFRSGCSINGLINMVYSQIKGEEAKKATTDRKKVTRRDAQLIVEQAIYNSYRQKGETS